MATLVKKTFSTPLILGLVFHRLSQGLFNAELFPGISSIEVSQVSYSSDPFPQV